MYFFFLPLFFQNNAKKFKKKFLRRISLKIHNENIILINFVMSYFELYLSTK